MKTLLALLLAIGMASAAITVNYTGTYATIKNGGTTLANLNLMNSVTFNGTDYFISDCDILKCRMLLNITPTQSWTLSPSNHISGKVAKSINGLTSADAVLIRKDTTETYYEPTYAVFVRNYTETNNSTGQNTTVFYNSTEQNGTVARTRPVTNWNTLNDGVTLTAGTPVIVALDYKRSKVNDTADLVPSLFGLDMSNWAWWNTTWINKVQINITKWQCSAANCAFPIYFATASYGTGSDWRFLDSTEATSYNYWYEDGNFSAGTGNVWVNATNNTAMLYLYYNMSSGGNNISSIDSVFIFGDDFSNTTLNTSKWTQTTSGTPVTSISAGKLTIGISSGSSNYNKLTSTAFGTNSFTTQMRITAMSNPPTSTSPENQIQTSLLATVQQYAFSNTSSQLRSYEGSRGFNSIYNYYTNQTTFASGGETWILSKVNETRICVNYNNINSICNYTGISWKNQTYLQHFQNSGTSNHTYDYVITYPYQLATPTFTFGGAQNAPIPPSAAYLRTAVQSYNNTHVTYSFTAIAENLNVGAAALTNANVSIWANGSIIGSKLVNISAGGADASLTATWAAWRGGTDSNFTALANITATNGSAQDSVVVFLPIDPPNAMATKHPLYAPILTSWNPLQWVWGQLYSTNITITGTPFSWTWATVNRGAGTLVRNGTAQSWAWVAQ